MNINVIKKGKTMQYINQNPKPSEYLLLRKLVGWGEMPIDIIEKALTKNIYAVCAYNEIGEIVGSARIVGDGGLCFYIQDVMVHPQFQKQGIGTGLLVKVMEYLKINAPYNSYIGLMAAKDLEHFYQKFGFQTRSNEFMGSGMIQFWGRGKELTEV